MPVLGAKLNPQEEQPVPSTAELALQPQMAVGFNR